jgi:hypothetical protein
MKKTLVLAAVLLGAVSASQAGVHFGFGLNLPLPPLPGVVIGQPAPAYSAPSYSPYYGYNAAPPVYVAPPSVYVAPPPVYFGWGPYWHARRGWDYRTYRGWGHDRHWR